MTASPTAPDTQEAAERVRITHPFHPLHGRELTLVDERRNRHGDRVWYEAADGAVHTVPRGWTSLASPDAFEVVAAGRASFRPEDLLGLAVLLDEVQHRHHGEKPSHGV